MINAVTDQPVAIVSDVPGTTTDPVYKAMELLPLDRWFGGLPPDSTTPRELGERRRDKALRVLQKTDLALLVADARAGISPSRRNGWKD